MTAKIVTVFDDIKGWFGKFFKKAPSWTVTALASISVVAPEAEILLDLADPAVGAIVTPIITEVIADLGTVANLLKNGNTANLPSLLAAIKANLSSLLTAGHITNPASVTKATGIVGAIIGVVDSISAEAAAAGA